MTSRFPLVAEPTGHAVLDLVRGCTFDDFILSPQHSVLARRDPAAIDLSCRLSRHIRLERPIVSANMDTVTRAPMAIVQAEEGGIGIIDRGFRPGEIEPQVREVEIVKRTQHGVITDPYSVSPSSTLADATAQMRKSRVGTLVVVDDDRRLAGLLTERDVRFVSGANVRVSDRMTPVDRLVGASRPAEPRGCRAADDRSQGQEAAARQRGRSAARAGHRARSPASAAYAIRDPRRAGPPSRWGSHRRDGRLSRAGRRAGARRRRRHRDRHRARPFRRHGQSDGGVPQALRGRRDDRGERRDGGGRAVSRWIEAPTGSRSASGPVAGARRA